MKRYIVGLGIIGLSIIVAVIAGVFIRWRR